MEAYVRVDKPKDSAPISENEVRVMAAHNMRNYISYTLNLLKVRGQLSGHGNSVVHLL